MNNERPNICKRLRDAAKDLSTSLEDPTLRASTRNHIERAAGNLLAVAEVIPAPRHAHAE